MRPEESSFHHAQDESKHVKGQVAAYKHCRHGGQPPAYQEKSHPDLGANPVQDEIAWKSAERVAEEEKSRTERISLFCNSDGCIKGLFGKADIGAVQERDDIHEHEHRGESPECARHGSIQRYRMSL